jgi:hypothetical protein
VGLPGAAAAADEADSVMQPFSSPADAPSHRADAALEYSNLPPDLSAKERFCHMLLRNPPCFFRLPCLMTDDSSEADIACFGCFEHCKSKQAPLLSCRDEQQGGEREEVGGGGGVESSGGTALDDEHTHTPQQQERVPNGGFMR